MLYRLMGVSDSALFELHLIHFLQAKLGAWMGVSGKEALSSRCGSTLLQQLYASRDRTSEI